MENARHVNVFSDGCGRERRRECSIPQGCPLSMCVITLLTTIWARYMERVFPDATTRMLADDLLVGIFQEEGSEAHTDAELKDVVQGAIEFLALMGAKLSPT
eukprot:13343585-Alexandrium_andersonii.AAC.1